MWSSVAWLLLFLFAGLAVYVMAGYPLLLSFLARRRPHPVFKSLSFQPPVSILLAVHNGAPFLAAKLDSLLASDYPPQLMEIIVAADGCTDRTVEIAQRYPGVRVLNLPRAGKPSALNAAVSAASHQLLVFTDVRQTLDPHSLSQLVACLADPSVGVASGYLVIRSGDLEQNNVGLYWRYERWIRSNLSTLDSMMGATGAFYALRRDLFHPMPPDLLLDDMFLPLHAFFQGYRLILEERARVYDIPTHIRGEFRRKIRTLAGNYQLFHYFPQLFTFRNRMLMHFLSYKFGRLMLPWFVLGVFIASCFIGSPWSAWLVTAQLSVYGIAAIDALIPAGVPFKILTSPLRSVVSLLAASACAVCILFVPARRLWK